MIDSVEPLSCVLWLVAFFAAGMYPLGFMMGAPCSPCCSHCLMYETKNWSGSAADAITFNTDGTFGSYSTDKPTYIVSGGTGTKTGYLNYTTTLNLLTDKITVVIAGTYTLSKLAWSDTYFLTRIPFSVTLERIGAYNLDTDSVYVLSTVAATSIPETLDEYGRKCIDSIGSFSVRRSTGVNTNCACGCLPSFYGDSAAVRPNTYSLTFLEARSPNPMLGVENSYSGFMPPAPFRGGNGCFNLLPRLLLPIVMRQVVGTNSIYRSDPILRSPCNRVVYQFDACTGTLNVASMPFNYLAQTKATGQKLAALANCFWSQAEYTAEPTAYSQAVNTHVYAFGFAVVAPGGTYAPEVVTSCSDLSDPYMFLSEGCDGNECPKDISITLNISAYPTNQNIQTRNSGRGLLTTVDSTFADRAGLNGTYVVPYTNPSCPTLDNYSRGYYKGTFAVAGGGTITIVIERGEITYNFSTPQCPECNTALLKIAVSYANIPVGTVLTHSVTDPNIYRITSVPGFLNITSVSGEFYPAQQCFPMCGSDLTGTAASTGTERVTIFRYGDEFVGSYYQTASIKWTLT